MQTKTHFSRALYAHRNRVPYNSAIKSALHYSQAACKNVVWAALESMDLYNTSITNFCPVLSLESKVPRELYGRLLTSSSYRAWSDLAVSRPTFPNTVCQLFRRDCRVSARQNSSQSGKKVRKAMAWTRQLREFHFAGRMRRLRLAERVSELHVAKSLIFLSYFLRILTSKLFH